jgi:predicted acylesterase/phospholipase RssA
MRLYVHRLIFWRFKRKSMPGTFRDKLQPSPHKKLLALDGGGIRGVITLEVLEKIERIARTKSNRPDLVLADYFDYVAGTSTGAIIAACIATGMAVTDIRRFYVESGPDMFSRAGLLRRFHYKFERERLEAMLQNVFGSDTCLGSARLRTLLMMVMRNATTDSPWPVSNNPFAIFNDPARPDCNLNLPLWQLVRASTAAPTYFPPEFVQVGNHEFLFEDGGVTMYNNPAFQLFLMATADPYRLKWAVGEDRILLVSIGTGVSSQANENLQPDEMNLLYQAGSISSALMYAALNEQDFLCRVFGHTRAGAPLDREVRQMHAAGVPGVGKLFTYMRYNAELTETGLAELGIANVKPAHVQALDSVDHIAEMQAVGRAVAERGVSAEHFEGF